MPLATDDFLDIDDVTPAELDALLDRAAAIKSGETTPRLADATLGMIFEKPSTRTRVSFETGMTRLGGHAMFLGPDDIQLGHGEPLRDTARVLGRYVDGVMARLFDHEDVETLAANADCPVINGLTDEAHPCQTLADLLTIRETVGEDASVAWVGDGNNVGQSFVVGAAMAGIDVSVATPAEYGMDPAVFERAAAFGADVEPTTDPEAAVGGADIVYTDVWISMGQEDERDEKARRLRRVPGERRPARRHRREGDALPARPPRRGDHRRRARIRPRPRLGPGRKPDARAERAARRAAGRRVARRRDG